MVKNDVRRLQIAAVCQFTLPEPPIVYYGTEVGVPQLRECGRLEESRLPMRWAGKGRAGLGHLAGFQWMCIYSGHDLVKWR